MDSPRGSAEGGWHRPGLKALSTLSLGIYSSRSHSATNIFKAKKTFEHTITPFAPVAAENLRINPDPEYLMEGLKVTMMRLGPTEQIPLQHNFAVNVLLESLQEKFCETKAAKMDAEEARKELKERVEAWSVLEADYKKEIRNLEVFLAGGEQGSDCSTLARPSSPSRKDMGEHINLSGVTAVENANESGVTRHETASATVALHNQVINHEHRKAFRKETSMFNCAVANDKAKNDGLRRQNTKATAATSNRVFDHKRMSGPANDKLLPDFGTLMDSELSKTIQQNEDALAGASRDRWFEARRREGHTGMSSSSDGSEGWGLGLTLHDPPMAPSYHPPLPPPIIVEPEDEADSDEDDGDDEGEELVKLPGGGYYVKPPNRRGAGGRAKTLFGLGKKKVFRFQNSDTSSPSSSDSDDLGPRGIAQGLASAHFIAMIASPMVGAEQEQSTTPPKKVGGLKPPKQTFKNANKSYTKLPALAQQLMHSKKKDSSKKSDDIDQSRHPARPNAKYDKVAAQLQNVMLSRRRPLPEPLRPATDDPPLPSGHEVRKSWLEAMEDEESREEVEAAYGTASPHRYHGTYTTPIAHRSISNLLGERVHNDHDEIVSTHDKSNGVSDTFEEHKANPEHSSLPRTSSSLGLGLVADAHHPAADRSEQDPFPPYVEDGCFTEQPRAVASDRLYDPRIIRKPSAVPYDNRVVPTDESDQQDSIDGQNFVLARAKSTKEEMDMAEAASRRVLWRASGHKFKEDEHASFDDGLPRTETFHESVARRQSEASRGNNRPHSMASVVTALYNPRDSVIRDNPDGHLPRAELVRGGISGNLVRLTGNAGSSNRGAGSEHVAEPNRMPHSSSKQPLGSIRLSEENQQTRRGRGSVSSISSVSAIATHITRESLRGKKNFKTSLRNAMKPSNSKKDDGKAEDPRLSESVSATNLGGLNHMAPAKRDFVIPRHPHNSLADTSRISDSSEGYHTPPSDESAIIVHKPRDSSREGEEGGPRSRPVTAIYQGPETSKARPFSFAPADERQFSTDRTHVKHDSHKKKETPARSLRHPFGGRGKTGDHMQSPRDSLEIISPKASAFNSDDHDNRPPNPFLASDWREESSAESSDSDDSDDSDVFSLQTAHKCLNDAAECRHENARESGAVDGGQNAETASSTALAHKKSDGRVPAPKMDNLDTYQTSLRRGGSGQYLRSGSRMHSKESVSSLRRRMVERQASRDQRESQNRLGEAHKVVEKEPNREQRKPMKSLAKTAKVAEKKPSRDGIVRTSSTGSIIAIAKQRDSNRPPPPPPKDQIEAKRQSRDGSGQHGRVGHVRVPSGPRQASGEKTATATVPMNPALAAARSAEAAAKKKQAEEAEKNKENKKK